MAEALAGVAVAASFTQLLSNIIGATQDITDFYGALKDASAEANRQLKRIGLIRARLECLQTLVEDISTEHPMLPLRQRQLLRATTHSVWEALIEVQKGLRPFRPGGDKFRSQLRWAFLDRHTVKKLQDNLAEAERCLDSLLQIIGIRMTTLNQASIDQIISNHAVLRSDLASLRQPTTIVPSPELSGNIQCRQTRNYPRVSQGDFRAQAPFLIVKGSWLSIIGLSGSVGFYATEKFLHQSIWLSFGFRLPFGLLSKLLTAELVTCHPKSCWSDIWVSSGRIRLRNMVPRHTDFLRACLRADLHSARWHLENGTGNVNDVDPDGASPLHYAIEARDHLVSQSSKIELVRFLIESGADICATNSEQLTALHLACRGRSHDLIRLLLQHEAPLDVVSAYGDTPMSDLEWMNNNSRFESLKLLYAALPIDFGIYKTEYTILHSAAPYATEEEASWLLEHGADGGACTRSGYLPLHLAAASGNSEMVYALVEHRGVADLEKRDAAGWTPLHMAAFRGGAHNMHNGRPTVDHMSGSMYQGDYCGTIAELMYAGADMTAQTTDGQSLTPYELAEMLGPEEHSCYLFVSRDLGKDIPPNAYDERFWDTCNGDCHWGKIVYVPRGRWPPTIVYPFDMVKI